MEANFSMRTGAAPVIGFRTENTTDFAEGPSGRLWKQILESLSSCAMGGEQVEVTPFPDIGKSERRAVIGRKPGWEKNEVC